MRYLFNRFRLTTTLEIDAGETVLDSETMRKRALKHYTQLQAEGKIIGHMDFSEALFTKFGTQGPPFRQRHILVIGIPPMANIEIKSRSLSDRLKGIVAKVEVIPGGRPLDPRHGFGFMAMVANQLERPMTSLDEVYILDILKNLPTLLGDGKERVTFPIYTYRKSKVLHSLEFGDLLLLRDGRLGLGLVSPEKMIDPSYRAHVTDHLRSTLLEPQYSLSQVETDAMILRWQIVCQQLHLWSRLRLDDYAGVWPLEDIKLDNSRSEPTRVFNIPMQISADSMTATIVAPIECEGCIGPAIPTIQDLQLALRPYKINKLDGEVIAQLLADIAGGKSIEGKVIAKGSHSTPDSKPYLRIAAIRELSKPLDLTGDVDPRQKLPKQFAQKAELIAVVEYEEKGNIGSDVYGHMLPASIPAEDQFVAGSGVKRQGGAFFATIAGAIKCDGQSISIVETLHIAGDVEASHGDITIPRAAIIDGSVDHGVSLDAKSSLKIGQSFAGRYLRVNGSLEIGGGIVGDDDTTVLVIGDLKVKFIQGGRIRCTGQVTIESHMSGGTIEADGNITILSPEGGIFGGSVVSGGSIVTVNLGKLGSSLPKVWFGTHPKRWRQMRILYDRQQTLLEARNQIQRQGHTGLPPAPGTSNHPQAMIRNSRKVARVEALERLQRVEVILEKIDQRLKSLGLKGEIRKQSMAKSSPSLSVTGIGQPNLRMCQESTCIALDGATSSFEVVSQNERMAIQSKESLAAADKK